MLHKVIGMEIPMTTFSMVSLNSCTISLSQLQLLHAMLPVKKVA